MASNELTYNIVYRIQGEDRLQKSLTLVESLTGDVKSLEQAVSRSGTATAKQSKALRENAIEQQRNIDRLRRIRSSLEKTDPLYAKITNSINRSSRSLREIDQVQTKYNRTTQVTQGVYNTTLMRLNDLSLSYRELQSQVRQNTGTDEQAARRSEELKRESDRLGVSLEQLEADFESLAKSSGISAAQMTKLRQAMVQARNGSISATRAVQGISTAFTGTTKVSSSANQLLLSFGDIAQDSAQFSYGFAQGARAIGNNIAFASEQILILTQKMEANKKGSATFSGVLKELGTQLIGPVGIIVGINAAITALTMYATWQERTKKKTEEATEAFKEQAQELLNITQGFGFEGEFAFFDITGAAAALQSLDKLGKGSDVLSKQIRALGNEYSNINARSITYSGLAVSASNVTSDLSKQIESLRKSQQDYVTQTSKVLDQFPVLEKLSSEAREELVKLSEEYRVQQELQDAAREQIRLTAQGGEDYLRVIDETRRITKELEFAEAERALGLETTGITQEQAREQLNALAISFSIGSMSADLYKDAILRVASAYSQLNKESDETAVVVDETTRNFIDGIIDLGRGELEEFIKNEEEKRKEALKTARLRSQYERLYGLDAKMVAQEYSSVWNAHYGITNKDAEEGAQSQKDSASMILRATTQFTSQLMTLRAQNSAQNEREARKQFETNKKLAYASAVVGGAAAIVDVFRQQKGGAIAKSIAAGLVAAAVGIQIAQIKQQQFSYGGAGVSSGDAGGKTAKEPSFGFEMSRIEGPQTFRTPSFTATDQRAPMQPKVDVKIMADRKQLYAVVKKGEEEYRTRQA